MSVYPWTNISRHWKKGTTLVSSKVNASHPKKEKSLFDRSRRNHRRRVGLPEGMTMKSSIKWKSEAWQSICWFNQKIWGYADHPIKKKWSRSVVEKWRITPSGCISRLGQVSLLILPTTNMVSVSKINLLYRYKYFSGTFNLTPAHNVETYIPLKHP